MIKKHKANKNAGFPDYSGNPNNPRNVIRRSAKNTELIRHTSYEARSNPQGTSSPSNSQGIYPSLH